MFPEINDGGLITGYYQKQYWRNVILGDLVSGLKAGTETQKVTCLCSASLGEAPCMYCLQTRLHIVFLNAH